MSTSGGSAIDLEIAAGYRTIVIQNYLAIVAATLLLHDTAITLGRDIQFIWKRKRSSITLLFAANRIFGIMFAAGLILRLPNWPQLIGCIGITVYFMVPELLLFVVWALFSALRVYTIGGKAWRTALVVFLLALVPLGVQLSADSTSQFLEVYIIGDICSNGVDVSTETVNILEIVARAPLIVADAIVLIITWQHTYSIRKTAAALNIKTSLGALILRDGTVFFATGLVLNVAQIVTFFVFSSINLNNGLDLSYLVISASCIIVSRFFLSLRGHSEGELDSSISGVRSGTLQITPGVIPMMGEEADMSVMLFSSGCIGEEMDAQDMEASGEVTQPHSIEAGLAPSDELQGVLSFH